MLLTFVFLITVIVIMTMIMMTMMMIVETLTNITVVIPHLNFCALNLSSFQYIIIISSNTLLSLYLRTRHSLLLQLISQYSHLRTSLYFMCSVEASGATVLHRDAPSGQKHVRGTQAREIRWQCKCYRVLNVLAASPISSLIFSSPLFRSPHFLLSFSSLLFQPSSFIRSFSSIAYSSTFSLLTSFHLLFYSPLLTSEHGRGEAHLHAAGEVR